MSFVRLLSRSDPQQAFSGVIQRLVQKEKQVLQLQAEVDQMSKSHKLPDVCGLIKGGVH
jgi:predicted CopG family antitoxin